MVDDRRRRADSAGCHPLSAVLHLKQVEAKARGETIGVSEVTCDVGALSPD